MVYSQKESDIFFSWPTSPLKGCVLLVSNELCNLTREKWKKMEEGLIMSCWKYRFKKSNLEKPKSADWGLGQYSC